MSAFCATRYPIIRSRFSKLECVILRVIHHCDGRFEGSLNDWVRALHPVLPCEDLIRVRGAFERLRNEGFVDLAPAGEARETQFSQGAETVLVDEIFAAVLTAKGYRRQSSLPDL